MAQPLDIGGGWPHIIALDPHGAGLAVARRMVRAGARVTVLAEPDRWELRSRGVNAVAAPYEQDGAAWLAVLREIAASGEDVLVLPATDRASELLVHAAGDLPSNLRMFEREGAGHLALMDKDTADEIARRAGVPVPWTARIRDEAERDEAFAAAPWPCVVKPIMSHEWRARYGEPYAFRVADADEAAALLEAPLRDGVGMLLCQYIPGGDDAVEEAIVVRLADGSYPVRFGCHKLRQHPRGFGATALGESSTLPETMALAERVLDEAGFVGVAGVEAKRHAETGERWFLEVNVRIPGQWGLGDACGADATRRLVAALWGRELPPQEPLRPGVRIVVPDLDVRVLRAAVREVPAWRRSAFVAAFLRPWLGAREVGLLDMRDPCPGLAWIGRAFGRRLRRAARPADRITDPAGSQ
jgi:predicted ATP-grasp superfamily ATP-dependent carboligase